MTAQLGPSNLFATGLSLGGIIRVSVPEKPFGTAGADSETKQGFPGQGREKSLSLRIQSGTNLARLTLVSGKFTDTTSSCPNCHT